MTGEEDKDHLIDGKPCVSATLWNKVLIPLFYFGLTFSPVLCTVEAEAD